MQRIKLGSLKGSIVVIATVLSPLAFGQQLAQTQVEEEGVLSYGFEAGDWNAIADYNSQSSTQDQNVAYIANGAAGNASADFSTHTVFANGNGNALYNPADGVEDTAFNAAAYLTDTINYATSGLVHFQIDPAVVFNGGGDDLESASVSLTISSAADGVIASGSDYAQFYTYYDEETGAGSTNDLINGIQQQNSWKNVLAVSFIAQAGVTYTISTDVQSTIGFYTGYVPIGQNYFGPGYAGVDPTWYMQVQPGMTYTTGSGYQISPGAVPEPSTFMVAGLGCASLLIRRRSRSR